MAELLQSQPAGAAVAPGQPQPESVSRWAIFAHAVFFVFGFTLIFTLMGSAAGLLGRNLNRELLELLQKFGAIMLVIFGLATLGVFRWLVGLITARVNLATNPAAEALVSLLEFPNKLLYTEKRVTGMHQVNRKWGYFSSSLLGISGKRESLLEGLLRCGQLLHRLRRRSRSRRASPEELLVRRHSWRRHRRRTGPVRSRWQSVSCPGRYRHRPR